MTSTHNLAAGKHMPTAASAVVTPVHWLELAEVECILVDLHRCNQLQLRPKGRFMTCITDLETDAHCLLPVTSHLCSSTHCMNA